MPPYNKYSRPDGWPLWIPGEGEEARKRAERTLMPRYIVIENTPGYMPEDDDPATFDDYRAAVRYMIELVRSSRDYSLEGGADIGGWLDRETGEAFLVDEGRPHDLGRHFSVVLDES